MYSEKFDYYSVKIVSNHKFLTKKTSNKKDTMACFICNQNGHWARNCPMATCKFCGEIGHYADDCKMQQKYKIPSMETDTIVEVPSTRTRSRRVCAKTLDDILFENHLSIQPSMRSDIDAFVKTHFTFRGMVDDYKLANDIFSNMSYSSSDNGHLTVIGYIVAKYCDVSNPNVKEFLRSLMNDIDDWGRFNKIINRMFGVGSFVKNGDVYFRKLTGFSI